MSKKTSRLISSTMKGRQVVQDLLNKIRNTHNKLLMSFLVWSVEFPTLGCRTRVWISSEFCSPLFENQLPAPSHQFFRVSPAGLNACLPIVDGVIGGKKFPLPVTHATCFGKVSASNILSQMNQGIKEIDIFIPHCRALDIFLMPPF